MALSHPSSAVCPGWGLRGAPPTEPGLLAAGLGHNLLPLVGAKKPAKALVVKPLLILQVPQVLSPLGGPAG